MQSDEKTKTGFRKKTYESSQNQRQAHEEKIGQRPFMNLTILLIVGIICLYISTIIQLLRRMKSPPFNTTTWINKYDNSQVREH